MFYFAYGSNMSHRQMADRCHNGHHRFLGAGLLKDFSFIFDGESKTWGGPVANVVSAAGELVWGGIFEIDANCQDALDKSEGYPTTYGRREMTIELEGGEAHSAWVYLRPPSQQGLPTAAYRERLIEGARDCGLPGDYVKSKIAGL